MEKHNYFLLQYNLRLAAKEKGSVSLTYYRVTNIGAIPDIKTVARRLVYIPNEDIHIKKFTHLAKDLGDNTSR